MISFGPAWPEPYGLAEAFPCLQLVGLAVARVGEFDGAGDFVDPARQGS